MHTILELDDQLLARAMEQSGETTERGVVEAGLRLLIQTNPLTPHGEAKDPEPPAGFVKLGFSGGDRAEARQTILRIAANHSLNGLKIKDLIEEGRH